jgi:hypothetical protein
MARRGPTLIYVHGAGTQPPESDWIRIHNRILFPDRAEPPTDLGYYADLIERPAPGEPADPAEPTDGPEPAHGLEAPASLGSGPSSSGEPIAAGQELHGILHESVERAGRTHEAHLLLLRLAAAMGPADHRSRFAMPGHVIPPAVRDFYREVSGYLHGAPELAEDMRQRVRAAIERHDGRLVVLAHSLGSIVAFDVLGEPGMSAREIDLVTVGSALGLGPAQDHLRAWRGSRPIGIPDCVVTWRNFQAAGDPVAVGTGLDDLRSDFAPALRVHATEVRNEAEWHHALSGYLEAPEVRDTIDARLTDRPRPG